MLEINQNILTISIFLFVIGFVVLLVGIIRWWKRQNVIDEIQNEDLIFRKMQNLSWYEKREIIEEEINNTDESIKPKEIQTAIDNYLEIENSVFSNVSLNYSNNYQIFQNTKIENSEYDIILRYKKTDSSLITSDKIIEIKYYKNDIILSNLQDSLLELIKNCQTYTKVLKKNVQVYYL